MSETLFGLQTLISQVIFIWYSIKYLTTSLSCKSLFRYVYCTILNLIVENLKKIPEIPGIHFQFYYRIIKLPKYNMVFYGLNGFIT